MDGGGWDSYYNSIQMALLTAVVGTVVVFVGAYVVEKTRGFETGRALFQLLAMLPMAIPGMVLGLAYIFFFNDPRNPLNAIYGTLRSEEHTSELQSLMRISYAVFCLQKKTHH